MARVPAAHVHRVFPLAQLAASAQFGATQSAPSGDGPYRYNQKLANIAMLSFQRTQKHIKRKHINVCFWPGRFSPKKFSLGAHFSRHLQEKGERGTEKQEKNSQPKNIEKPKTMIFRCFFAHLLFLFLLMSREMGT